MAFKETSTETQDRIDSGPSGLPVSLDSVRRLQCPRCMDELEDFAHVSRYVCYSCGFKVSFATVARIQLGEKVFSGYGFGLSQFKDETPF